MISDDIRITDEDQIPSDDRYHMYQMISDNIRITDEDQIPSDDRYHMYQMISESQMRIRYLLTSDCMISVVDPQEMTKLITYPLRLILKLQRQLTS